MRLAFTVGGLLVLLLPFSGIAAFAQPDPENFVCSFSEVEGPSGSEQTVICLFDDPRGGIDIDGRQLVICHDDTLVQPIEFMLGETTLIINDGEPPDFVLTQIIPGEGVRMGVVISVIPGAAVLPPGSGYELLEITYLLEGPSGEIAALTYDCVILMVFFTVFVYDGGAPGAFLIPTLLPGAIEIIALEFVRGDCDGDGVIDLADPIYNLAYLFQEGRSLCLDAQDTNDDGTVNIADPVYNINYQFAMGPPPPVPFPDCGLDPTADALGCESFAACP